MFAKATDGLASTSRKIGSECPQGLCASQAVACAGKLGCSTLSHIVQTWGSAQKIKHMLVTWLHCSCGFNSWWINVSALWSPSRYILHVFSGCPVSALLIELPPKCYSTWHLYRSLPKSQLASGWQSHTKMRYFSKRILRMGPKLSWLWGALKPEISMWGFILWSTGISIAKPLVSHL